MRLITFIKISAVWLVLAIAGCATPSNRTGFVIDGPGADLAAKTHSGTRVPALRDLKDKIVIVYNHGTTLPQQVEDCSAWVNQVPRSLLAIQSQTVLIYYLCSAAREPYTMSGKYAGQYIYGRLKEVEATLDELTALGVSPKNIFLAGHSAGGWTSLMAQRYFGKKFNAAVVFAPAFAGRRSQERFFPWWRQEVRPRQIREILEAPEINALIFAYHDDPFDRPEDIKFLTERYPQTAQIIGYKCDIPNEHLVHLNDCREVATTEAIGKYIQEMAKR